MSDFITKTECEKARDKCQLNLKSMEDKIDSLHEKLSDHIVKETETLTEIKGDIKNIQDAISVIPDIKVWKERMTGAIVILALLVTGILIPLLVDFLKHK